MQENHFEKSLFLVVLTSDGNFENYEEYVCFLEKALSWKIVANFLKRAQDHLKLTFFDPPNILNKLLSKNPTLTKRYEVNKFNLVFSINTNIVATS